MKMYGFKDLFKYSNVVICINLKYTKKKELNKYPCLFANESSFFTQRINSYKYLSNQYNHLANLASKQVCSFSLILIKIIYIITFDNDLKKKDGKIQIKDALATLENEIASFKNGQNFSNKIDTSSTMTRLGNNSNSSNFKANSSFLSTNDIPTNVIHLDNNLKISTK